MSGKTKRGHAVSSLASQRQKIQQAQGQEFGARAILNRVDIDQRPPMSPQKAASETGRPTRLSAPSQRRCHVARRANLQIHQALHCRTRTRLFSGLRTRALPLADQIETITTTRRVRLSRPIATSLGALSYFAKPYHSWERGLNDTLTASSGSTSQRSDFSILSDADPSNKLNLPKTHPNPNPCTSLKLY